MEGSVADSTLSLLRPFCYYYVINVAYFIVGECCSRDDYISFPSSVIQSVLHILSNDSFFRVCSSPNIQLLF